MNNFQRNIYRIDIDSIISSIRYSFDGACGTGIPTRVKIDSNTDLSDGCSFNLVITGGSVTFEASSSLNSGTSLNTSFSITGFGSSSILNSTPGSTIYGNIITLLPGSYTGTFGYVYSLSQGTSSVRVTNI